jgi:outer membrane protein OmpA-like peptidoglycan-associated protein
MMRMLIVFAAFAFSAATVPVFAQPATEMDRAESELRRDMAPAGVAIERVAPDEIRLSMPSDITFDFDRAQVRREFMPRINDLARTLVSYPGMSVQIIGHADARGSDSYNQELSERRARAVGARLLDYGVQYERIEASGRGEWEPIATNADEWGRARNRRVEIRISSKPKY